MPSRSLDRVPDALRRRFDAIVSLTDGVCRAHLTEEYAVLARDLTTTLGRKRPSPLVQGRAPTWACGITYALGMVNAPFAVGCSSMTATNPRSAPHDASRS